MAIYLLIQEEDQTVPVQIKFKPIVLGRSSKCEIQLKDESISGRHLEIKLSSQGQTLAKDLDSTNGSSINGNNFSEALLFIEDTIMVGEVSLWLDVSKMSSKERKLHSNDAMKTDFKSVDLLTKTKTGLVEKDQTIPDMISGDCIFDDTDTEKELPDEIPRFSRENENAEEESDEESGEPLDEDAKTRVSESKEDFLTKNKKRETVNIEPPSRKDDFKLNKSSGTTEFIEVGENEKSKKVKKLRSKKTEEEKRNSGTSSFVHKIKNLFKKGRE